MLSSTPWGEPQTSREIAPGICFYSTARHGGYHLSPDRFETFRQFFPDYVLWAGDPWFEEDCDAALVTLTFAAEFSDQSVFFAEQSIRACVKRERTTDTPWLRVWTSITHNETLAAVLHRADKFRLEHGDDWQVGCAGTNDQGATMLNETMRTEDIAHTPRKPMNVTWQRSFFAALRALRHLYFQLERARLELHSNCEVCDEIRNFLAEPNYRGDNIANDNDWQPVFVIPRDALIHLNTKLDADGIKLHSDKCHGCMEIREFLSNSEYRGNLNDPLEVDMHRPLNYAPLNWVDKDYENSL